MEGNDMEEEDDLLDIERATEEEAPAPDERKGDIAEAWNEEFDEEMSWGDLVRWLGESG
jgi:hypothetical protein